jgi:heme/copper-type cytochrome/quinol oxidase subunit 2
MFKNCASLFRPGEVMAENYTGIFSAWDYVVLVMMLIISAAIGVYYRFTGGRQKTTQVSNNVVLEWLSWTSL